MNNDYQQNNQGQQDQYGNQQGQQDQYGNQQGQQDQYGNQNNQDQNNNQGGALGGARGAADNQINQAIDQFGNKIPGGSQYTDQAKKAASEALDNLQQEGEKRMGNLGGMFGGDNQ
ncbi:MAG: hypothetical protein H0V70_16760 [Ktedonobacteraceae bacterium]|nr:hypothetical protein [Ktedonobacteraceae bacterium]